MSALSKKLRDAEVGLVQFWCPGCNQAHGVRVAGEQPWAWNGDVERPTFSPSILVHHFQLSPEGRAMIQRGDPPHDGKRYPGSEVICHSFVTDGRIKFLADCTHALARQTVDLPEWTEIGT
jgi:hypothetical protein